MRKLFAGLMAVAALTAAAGAAPNLEFSIGLCAAKTNAKERLACYDAIAQRLKAGEVTAAAPPAPVVPPAPVAAAPAPAAVPAAPAPAVPAPAATAPQQTEAQFGAETLKKESREAAGAPEPLDEISGVIAKLVFSPTGRAIVTLDNGQVWRQIQGDSDVFRGKQGEKAKIERAILGSYNLTVEGRNQLIKVQRVR